MDTKALGSLGLEIGARLRMHRARLDLTQQEAGERAGMSWMSIHRYEHGRTPTIDALYRLAHAYGVQPAEFLPPVPTKGGKK